MKRQVMVSSTIINEVMNGNIAEELNAQSIETICKRHNWEYDLDDMYNINVYQKGEKPEDQYVWYVGAEETKDGWEKVSG